MESSINSFLSYLKFEKRYSLHTLTAYGEDLRQFFVFVQNTFEVEEVQQVTPPMLRTWIVALNEQSQVTTLKRKLSAIKSFYKFLRKKEIVTIDPSALIQTPKKQTRLPVLLRREEIENLFELFDFSESSDPELDRFILALLYGTGIRRAEALSLKFSDVDLNNRTIKVFGKRKKERIIPYTNLLNSEIQLYLSSRRSYLDVMSVLLVDKEGKALSESGIYQIVSHYLKQVSSVSKHGPHVLRHSYATHLLDQGADLNSVKELLGHASLASTQVYTHNSLEKLKKVYLSNHPKA